MRILHVINHTQKLNGNVHAAIDLACAQRKLGHEVSIASGGGDFDDLLSSMGIETVTVNHRRRPVSIMRAVADLNRYVGTFRPDVVHAHMMTSAVLAVGICRARRVPIITTVHNAFEKSAVVMKLGDRVIAVSEAVAVSMNKRGVPASKLCVVLNGTIGSPRLDTRDRASVTLAGPSILFVGGLHPRKGLPDLLEAFRSVRLKYKDARLYVVGGGPYEEAYKAIVRDTAQEGAVTFIGPVRDAFPYMMGADIFVLPSHADPAPLVLPEAREARCAVVGTDVDGIPQLLEYGAAGIIVPPKNPEALAAVLDDLVKSPSLVQEWQTRSQFRIENMTIDRVATETMEVYSSALSVRSRRPTVAVPA